MVLYMNVSVTELENNLEFYLEKAQKEDIYITKNGKIISKLSNPYQTRIQSAQALFNTLPDTISLVQAKNDRATKS